MKAKLLGVATALALLGASPAAAITYLISDNAGIPSDPQGGLFLTGSITTNGTIGTLSSVNIAAWNLNISGHGQLVTYTEFNSHFTLTGSALTATATALSFNYTATLGYSLQFFLDGGTGPGITWMADGDLRGRFALSFDPLVEGEVEFRPGIVSYPVSPPAAVPLPAALPLFATGLGVLGLLGWRRKRRSAPLPPRHSRHIQNGFAAIGITLRPDRHDAWSEPKRRQGIGV